MVKRTARIFGVLIAGLALAGLFVEDGHLFGLMNANAALDVLRIGLAAALLYVGFSDNARPESARSVLGFVGVLYIGMALLALVNSTLWGLLPSGLTGFDVVFHLAAGLLASGVAFMHHSDHAPHHA